MEDFKDQVKKGFNKCRLDIEAVKDDTSELNSEISSLKKSNVELDNSNSELKTSNLDLKDKVQTLTDELSELKGEIKGINVAIEYIKNFTQQQINGQAPVQVQTPAVVQAPTVEPEVVNEISQDNIKIMDVNEQPIIQPKAQASPNVKEDPYEALLAFKAKINKKEMLKQKLVSMVSDMGINLSELKFLFVNHYKYCSKATFYNYLKEIELEKLVVIRRENTKNFVYLNGEMIRDEI